MTTAKRISDAVKAFARHDGQRAVFETAERVHASGRFDEASPRLFPELVTAAGEIDVVATIEDATGEIIAPEEVVNHVGQPGRLTLTKSPTASTFYFFTIDGFKSFLQAPESESARQLFVAESEHGFSTVSCTFGPWEGAAADLRGVDTLATVSPKRFVRDMANRGHLSIGRYILSADPTDEDDVFSAWREAVLPRLRDAIVNELLPNDQLVLRGDRSVVVDGRIAAFDELVFDLATKAARWIYAEGTDVEVRFLLFTHELARLWPDDVDWLSGMRRYAAAALESAGNAYRQHLSETTNETLKALSDLRKALSDEVSKIGEQTRDNVGALWRDFAIALAAIIAHFTVDRPSQIDPFYSRLVLWVAALYLLIVLLSTLWANDRFANIAREGQDQWRTRLYGFLSDDDFSVLSTCPLQSARKVFSWMSWIVAGVYATTIIGLLVMSAPQAVSSGSVTFPSPSPTASKSSSPSGAPPSQCKGDVIVRNGKHVCVR